PPPARPPRAPAARPRPAGHLRQGHPPLPPPFALPSPVELRQQQGPGRRLPCPLGTRPPHHPVVRDRRVGDVRGGLARHVALDAAVLRALHPPLGLRHRAALVGVAPPP